MEKHKQRKKLLRTFSIFHVLKRCKGNFRYATSSPNNRKKCNQFVAKSVTKKN